MVLFTDAAVLTVAVTLAEAIRFGMDARIPGSATITYTVLGLVVAVMWWVALQLDGATDPVILGHGPAEYRRVAHASIMAFGVVAIVTLLLKQDLSRGYLAIAFPVGVTGLLIGRKALRMWLVQRRRSGAMTTNVLVIGGRASAHSLQRHFGRHPAAGYRVSGVWVPDASEVDASSLQLAARTVPILGNTSELADALRISEAGSVIVTDTEHLGQHGLKELTWELESLDVELLVSPNVVDVSGARMALTTVGHWPLLSVRKPTYSEAAAWPKRMFDLIGAAVLMTLAAPLLLTVALVVKVTSRGPILYRQERIGRDGRPFDMLKFRSMATDADGQLHQLLVAQGKDSGPLAKLDNDPRITRVGNILRRYSIDELPQLLNVLLGTMSLVGPRPQRQFEVERYDNIATRRLRVLPGMTGLWQVSGRSDLSWEDAVRLDNYYVENWSLLADLSILWRTVRAVVRRDGAR
ncbi:sugar transferase [Aeromicrobium sp. Sec7.5]|uniref:sugar transferase n=1 Tax=Aeromicrobium sp. Sec7.5 TaxID=3121276 RepID=UPI002FE42D1B